MKPAAERGNVDAIKWAETAAERLEQEFGDRLSFVGIQGSRARGEARTDSDIDLVVLLDSVGADDLERYRSIVRNMPECDLACGFVGSAAVLASWPRRELFQFYNDTKSIRGDLPAIDPFGRGDAVEAARSGASGIYHAACHAYVFEGEGGDDVLGALFKGAFFALQALHFARTGEYLGTKADLAAVLDVDDSLVLEIGRNWDGCRPSDDAGRKELVGLLLRWAESAMELRP